MTALHPHLSAERDPYDGDYRVKCDHADHKTPVLSEPFSVMGYGALDRFVNAHDHEGAQ